jgi:pre-mRNA-processing factor 19
MVCELSGEPLLALEDEVVVTPSGHLCRKSLLLKKLAENGGYDPFNEQQRLSEEQLVTLHLKQVPRPSNASLPSLLSSIRSEYDAVVLELYDTRQLLSETRQELTTALYQNDAAVRVIARLAQERDAARQELLEWQSSASSQHDRPVADDEPAAKRARLVQEEEDTAPAAAAASTDDAVLVNKIPESDWTQIHAAWDRLYQTRKPRTKAINAAVPDFETVATRLSSSDARAWHKTSCKGVALLSSYFPYVVTIGASELVAYHLVDQVVLWKTTLKDGSSSAKKKKKGAAAPWMPTCIDVSSQFVVVGTSSGSIMVWNTVQDDSNADPVVLDVVEAYKTYKEEESLSVVSVDLHPDQVHACVALSNGCLAIARLTESTGPPAVVSIFDSSAFAANPGAAQEMYSCGHLHPDGLIYVAATQTSLHLWDFQSQKLSTTWPIPLTADAKLSQVCISPNGYHVAVLVQESSTSGSRIVVGDLRKQTILADLNKEDQEDRIISIASMSFDPSGKYLLYGGENGSAVVTSKDWTKPAARLNDPAKVSAVSWGKGFEPSLAQSNSIIVCSHGDRKVTICDMTAPGES